jgi:hypothetical protein
MHANQAQGQKLHSHSPYHDTIAVSDCNATQMHRTTLTDHLKGMASTAKLKTANPQILLQ